MHRHQQSAVGLDIGATKWLALTASETSDAACGSVGDDPTATVAEILTAIGSVSSIGCSFAGVLDADGVVSSWPNRPAWRNFALASTLAAAASERVVLEDDGACAAIGERQSGTAAGFTSFLCITFGTGIGSGLFVDGSPCPQMPGIPAGMGHVRLGLPVYCRCGKVGCAQAVLLSQHDQPRDVSLRRFAELVADFAALLALNAVILTGGRLDADRPFAEALREELLSQLRGSCCKVRVSREPALSAAKGALALALDQVDDMPTNTLRPARAIP